MDERSSGLILRTRPLTETSLIVHWLTPDLGRIATVAKGARRPKSAFRGKLDLFYEAEFSFGRSKRSELHTLREVVLRKTHSVLREDLARLQQVSYAAALIEQTTETETPVPTIHQLMSEFLEQPTSVTMVLAFELKLLRELGLGPATEKSKLTPGTKQVIAMLSDSDWKIISRLRLTDAQKLELRQYLHGFLIYHLGKIPHGRTTVVS